MNLDLILREAHWIKKSIYDIYNDPKFLDLLKKYKMHDSTKRKSKGSVAIAFDDADNDIMFTISETGNLRVLKHKYDANPVVLSRSQPDAGKGLEKLHYHKLLDALENYLEKLHAKPQSVDIKDDLEKIKTIQDDYSTNFKSLFQTYEKDVKQILNLFQDLKLSEPKDYNYRYNTANFIFDSENFIGKVNIHDSGELKIKDSKHEEDIMFLWKKIEKQYQKAEQLNIDYRREITTAVKNVLKKIFPEAKISEISFGLTSRKYNIDIDTRKNNINEQIEKLLNR